MEKLKKNERPTHAHAPGWRAQGEDGDSGKKRSGRKEGTRAATHALTLTPVKAVNDLKKKKYKKTTFDETRGGRVVLDGPKTGLGLDFVISFTPRI